MLRSYILLPACVLFLSACAGGGGGGGSSSPAVTPFVSWSGVTPNSKVQANGGSAQLSYASTPATVITSVGNAGNSPTGAVVTMGYGGGNLNLTSVNIQAAQGASVEINTANGDRLTPLTLGGANFVYGVNTSVSKEVAAINAPLYAWDYQTYGVWITGEGTGGGTLGAVSAGNPTPAANIPATGSATFSGSAMGIFVVNGSMPYLTGSSMTANVNFSSRTIGFSTSGTVASLFGGGGSYSAPGLNLSGTLSYSAGTNTFGGGVAASNGTMSGSAAGKFYGPTASEIGGTYNISGGGATMVGGFGGKR